MAVLCLPTNTPWPWPTPAGAASARGGFPTLGTERERSGGGVAQRRSAQAQRGRLGCLLSRARDGVPQEGLVVGERRSNPHILNCGHKIKAGLSVRNVANTPAIEGP